jgi:hypothetical protein
MSWDEGKPMPSSDSEKKAEVHQMMGGKKRSPKEAAPESLSGDFSHARVEAAGNGFTLHVERKVKGVPEGDTGAASMGTEHGLKEYKTVHMHPQNLTTELSRHLVSGQTGSI